jgi:hypothetical protein
MIHNFDNFIKNIYEADTSAQQAAQQEMLINAEVEDSIDSELKDKAETAKSPTASLKFDGDYLHWLNNGVSVAKWSAYSGLSIANANIKDYGKLIDIKFGDPNQTSALKNAGPTPPGKYKLGKLQVRDGVNINSPETYKTDDISFLKALWVFKSSSPDKLEKLTGWGIDSDLSKIGWGDFRFAMTPAEGTDTKGRTDMYVHGGVFKGSHGCIDLTDQMPNFVKWYSAWLVQKENKGKTLTLNVEYTKTSSAKPNATYNNANYSQTTKMGTF